MVSRPICSYPTLTEIIGQQTPQADPFTQMSSLWLNQVEEDLKILSQHVAISRLIECYRSSLEPIASHQITGTISDQIIDTFYEIHASALLSKASTSVELHVPRGNGTDRNFDIRVTIEGTTVNADSKTRCDSSQLKRYNDFKENGEHKCLIQERPTFDPHDAPEIGLSYEPDAKVPESTKIRQRLLVCLQRQLPDEGCNLIIWGQRTGHQTDLEQALYGVPIASVHSNLPTQWDYAPTGAFQPGDKGEPFRKLSGVLWVTLQEFPENLFRDYKLYPNKHAETPIPFIVDKAINLLFKGGAP